MCFIWIMEEEKFQFALLNIEHRSMHLVCYLIQSHEQAQSKHSELKEINIAVENQSTEENTQLSWLVR